VVLCWWLGVGCLTLLLAGFFLSGRSPRRHATRPRVPSQRESVPHPSSRLLNLLWTICFSDEHDLAVPLSLSRLTLITLSQALLTCASLDDCRLTPLRSGAWRRVEAPWSAEMLSVP